MINQSKFSAQKWQFDFIRNNNSIITFDRHILIWNFYFRRYYTLNFRNKIHIKRYFQELSINNWNFEFEVILNIYEHTWLIWSWFYTQKCMIDKIKFWRIAQKGKDRSFHHHFTWSSTRLNMCNIWKNGKFWYIYIRIANIAWSQMD